jgi:hypothetical protein
MLSALGKHFFMRRVWDGINLIMKELDINVIIELPTYLIEYVLHESILCEFGA